MLTEKAKVVKKVKTGCDLDLYYIILNNVQPLPGIPPVTGLTPSPPSPLPQGRPKNAGMLGGKR